MQMEQVELILGLFGALIALALLCVGFYLYIRVEREAMKARHEFLQSILKGGSNASEK